MAEPLEATKRTHYCGDLRKEHNGQEVTLCGWVHRRRDLGNLIFIDLRDREGVAQVVFDPGEASEAHEKAGHLGREFVAAVKGVVRPRPEGQANPDMPTGEVEVLAADLKILNEAKVPPFVIADDVDANEDLRLKYRYLDLRRPYLHKVLKLRHQLYHVVRSYMVEHGFFEIETPVLTKSTPEGARDYIVPSRISPGKFYALPQSPQLFKQLLMIAGYDRYFQIVRCFRDEATRADRQPEFTQIDIEASFLDQDDLLTIIEGLTAKIFAEMRGVEISGPFPRITYTEAMDRYGTDRPDTRFGLELHKLDDLFAETEFGVFKSILGTGGTVRGLCAPKVGDYSRKQMDQLEEYAKVFGAKGLIWAKVGENQELAGPAVKFFSDKEKKALVDAFGAKAGDGILIVAGDAKVVCDALGNLRNKLAKELNLIDNDADALFWVVDFPLVEWNEEEERWDAAHHPFTSPRDEDIEKMETDPGAVLAKAYDLVWNGNEIAGGSIRIHRQDVQARMFDMLGISKEKAEEKFGFFLEALQYGTPPHGGIAYGLDRLVMLLAGTTNLRDVIPFPKTARAACLMTESPSAVEDEQLVELGIALADKKE